MYQTTDFKKGLKIEFDGKLFVIVETNHVNPGKGSAFVKTKLKNLETGQVLEKTFKAGVDTVNRPDCIDVEVEYMYDDQDGYNFMDQTSFETIHMNHDVVAEAKNYLKEGMRLQVLFHNSNPISLELPNFIVLEVAETDPGLKGDSAAGGTKKAIMDTGLQINVPLFIKIGEKLKVDTRTGEYVERAK